MCLWPKHDRGAQTNDFGFYIYLLKLITASSNL